METPKYYEFMNPTLQALRAGGGTLTNGEIFNAIINLMQLPDEVLDRKQHGRNLSEAEYRISWARSYLKKAGYLTQSARGVWALTSQGKETDSVDGRAIMTEVHKTNAARRKEKATHQALQESQGEVTGRSGDGGIDGKGVLRLGGLINFQVVFQSKRYAGTVSTSIVRDLQP